MTKLLLRVLYITFVFIVLPFSGKAETAPSLKKWGYVWDEYDSTLFYRLQSIDDVISYADSALGTAARPSRAYCEFLASSLRKRFYHGYSYYSAKDNWLAFLAGKMVWDHLHAIVLSDDILKHPMAACSQQSIVLKDCFKAIGIDYREVDLYGHFVLEGKVEGQWLLFDTNLEPRFPNGRKSLDQLIQSGELVASYLHVHSKERLKKIFRSPVYRTPNAPIAPNGTLFQQFTGYLSIVLPFVLPVLLILGLVFKISRHKEGAKDEVRFVEVERSTRGIGQG